MLPYRTLAKQSEPVEFIIEDELYIDPNWRYMIRAVKTLGSVLMGQAILILTEPYHRPERLQLCGTEVFAFGVLCLVASLRVRSTQRAIT